jgi:hypothetical protein
VAVVPGMMKRDISRTKAAKFKDRRSYWGTDGHVYLPGPRNQDKPDWRRKAFALHGEICAVCGAHAPEIGYEFTAAHWHHPRRCSCPEHTEVRCNPWTGRKCHRHGVSGFKRVADASKWPTDAMADDLPHSGAETNERGE